MSNEITFSIIIAIYNTEQYLSEAIESIINQTFDLNKIQIILVDDGSTDNSKDICHSFKNKYPNNIEYIYQENKGQSIARNNGLKIASGKYVNFLDSDDKLDLNALQEVYDLFEKSNEIDVVVIPRYNFGIMEGFLYLSDKYNPTRIVDIYEEPDLPQHAINASFIRRTELTERFNPELVISEDALLLNKTILKKGKFGVVSTTKYLYRKRAEQNSTIDTKKYDKNYFIKRIKLYFHDLINYSLSNFNEVIKYIQYVLMYDLQWFFRDRTHVVLNDKEFDEFFSLISEILQYIDDDVIISQRFLNNQLKYHILNLKHEKANFNLIYNSNEVLLTYDNKYFDNLTKNNIIISDVYVNNNLVYIKGIFDCYMDNFKIFGYNNQNPLEIIYINGKQEYSLNHQISNKIYFITAFELNEGINHIGFKLFINSKEYSVSLLNKTFNDDVLLKNNQLIFNYNKNVSIEKNQEIALIKQEINNVYDIVNSTLINLNESIFEKEILKINIKPKVSIIIPVYNPGKLLIDCLDSVLNQSLKEIEIICVNDGSSDNSKNVLEEYAKKDNRLRVFHQENQGAGIARNKGIKEASGEYMIFLDSDDWIEKDMCKKLYNQAKKLNSDFIIFDVLWHSKKGVENFSYFPNNEFKKDYKTYLFDYNLIKRNMMIGSLGLSVCKFYKSSFIYDNNIKFPQHKIYNDVEFHFKATLLAKKIGFRPEGFYHYIRLGQPSLQTSFREGKHEFVWFNVLDGLYNIFTESKLMEEFRLYFINYCIYYTFDKLKNIDDLFISEFLEKTKVFFEKLNPSKKELELIKTTNLTWYSKYTLNYIPIYEKLIQGDINAVKIDLLNIRLNMFKEKLEKTPTYLKYDFYQELRKKFIELSLSIKTLKELQRESSKFYIWVLNFESYHTFNLFNQKINDKSLKTIHKKELNAEIAHFNKFGVNLKQRNERIIVSLVSFPENIHDVHYCIYSILNQELKPDKIILCLAENQFPNKENDLTEELLKFKSNGLLIKWCKNINAYNKLIPILREYPNDYIITADENIFYPKDWIKNMWIQYKKTPNTIIVSMAKKISFDEYNNMMDYNEWKFINEYSGSSFLNFPIADGGVLYHPNSLSNLVFNEESFLKLCPTGEDIWFWAMAMLNKTKITTIENTLNDLIYINLARKSGILKEHTLECSNHKNNTQIKNIITEFPVILKIINKELELKHE